jgi:hypothetical protein
VLLGQFGRDLAQLGRDESQTLSLQPAQDFSDQPALDSIWLDYDKGAFHESRTLPTPSDR